MRKKLLSIIIPTYNNAEDVSNCIDSIVSQKHAENVEIIVINDGSTDNTLSVIKQYNSKVKLITQTNKGVSFSRNLGIKVAHGKYIWFIDADDQITADSISDDLLVMLENYSYDLYLFGMRKYWNQHIKQDIFNARKELVSKKELKKVFSNLFISNNLNSPCNKIYRTEFLRKNNLIFNGYANGEDAYFNYNVLLKMHTMMVLNDVKYVYYLEHPNKSISNYNKKRNNMDDAIQRIDYFEHTLKQLGIDINNGVYNREIIDTLLGIYHGFNVSNKRSFKADYHQNKLINLRHKIKLKGINFKYFVKALIAKSSVLTYVYLKQ